MEERTAALFVTSLGRNSSLAAPSQGCPSFHRIPGSYGTDIICMLPVSSRGIIVCRLSLVFTLP